MTEPQIRLALPSKGRMEEETLEFLAGCGLRVDKRNPRQYTATLPALPGVLVLFQRARDIPVSVAAGDVDLGITGYDAMAETGGGSDAIVTVHDALGYGECALVVAVPDDWAEVQTAADLARRAANERLRVATKYPLLVGRFLSEAGAESVRVVSADGALESAPTVGYADFIADITSTGTTLRENRLRPLSDGTILTSQAILIGNRAALQDRPDVLQATRQMLEFIEAHQRARGQYMIFANMRGESAEAVAARVFSQTDLGGLQGPTVAPMITREGAGGWWAINLVSSADKLYAAIQQIRAIGGSGVVVTPVTYIFEELPARYQRLLAALNREERVS
ncbi:MAG TPA: ATP phosphoribosyltransferase [Aggregatilineaceae bacterium]|nr:ATP phosphoribosyltransferase [Anaerolineae bacterium]HMM29486.1 ATP phosphoribosyltransferase [Aggregatilineaceae bacterium]